MCDGEWPLVLQPLTLLWSALLYFPNCLLDPPCPRTRLPVLLLKAWVREKAKNYFIELPAMALIEKCNTQRWVIGPIVTHEMCAIGDRLREYLSVHSTFAQLSQWSEPDFAGPLLSHPRVVQFPWLLAPCSLQNTRKTQFDTVLIYISMVSGF